MSESTTQTLDQINAAAERSRLAAIAAQTNAGSTGTNVSGTNAKRAQSSANKTNPNKRNKSTAPTTARKTSASKSKTTKTTKTSGPTNRDVSQIIQTLLVDHGAQWFKSLPVKTVKGTRYVTVNGAEYPRETVLDAVKQTFGYVSGPAWDKHHKILGDRNVGRPGPWKVAA
jgi:hypothetical protein